MRHIPVLVFLSFALLAVQASPPQSAQPDSSPTQNSDASSMSLGEAIMHSERLSCCDCHATRLNEDSDAPNLAGVGRRLTREEIIVAILAPSLTFADGHHGKTVVLASGLTVTGTLIEESASHVVIKVADDSTRSLDRKEIEEMTDAKSEMPEGLADKLTENEFWALLDYLQTI